jgi:hypothetical protein
MIIFPGALYHLDITVFGITITFALAKVQIDNGLHYAYTRTRAAHIKLPMDPCMTRSL